MNTFKDLLFKKSYTSLKDDLIEDLINPLLGTAVLYDRAVGFFSSSWLREVSSGLSKFASNGGKARIVTSLKLSSDDWDAIKNGLIEEVINRQVFITIEELKKALEIETLSTLSWMVANEVLIFRFALPIGKLEGGIFHTKLSLFYDKEGNGVAVFGSQNDSFQATINEESLNVFTSWDFGKEYFLEHKRAFEEKWAGNSNTLITYTIPEASKKVIIEEGIKYCYPYKKIEHNIKHQKELRGYQEMAIQSWMENDCHGLFEMATGSGKTFTAISAAIRIYEQKKKLFLVVLVPYQHLVEQWYEELCNFGFKSIACYKSKDTWESKAYIEVKKFNTDWADKICLIATHATSCLEPFQQLMGCIKKEWMLIADEVHGLGSKKQQKALSPTARYRIGLSATPARWFDKEGTSVLYDYFKKTVVTYSLEDAIKDGALTQYEYSIILTELNDEEIYNYTKYTETITKLFAKKDKNKEEEEILETLCRKRAKIIGCAEEKINTFINLIKQHKEKAEREKQPYSHNLFFCYPGQHDIFLRELSNIGLKVHEFVHTVPQKERTKILDAFENGDIEGLVAVKCLDEGVDVPATRRAYILASSTNPREFIQRRGRILRKIKNKNLSYIYDFLVGPWTVENYDFNVAQSLLRRELPRFAEFNDNSYKKIYNIDKIKDVCEFFKMSKELFMKPWEVYADINENYSDLLIEE